MCQHIITLVHTYIHTYKKYKFDSISFNGQSYEKLCLIYYNFGSFKAVLKCVSEDRIETSNCFNPSNQFQSNGFKHCLNLASLRPDRRFDGWLFRFFWAGLNEIEPIILMLGLVGST